MFHKIVILTFLYLLELLFKTLFFIYTFALKEENLRRLSVLYEASLVAIHTVHTKNMTMNFYIPRRQINPPLVQAISHEDLSAYPSEI